MNAAVMASHVPTTELAAQILAAIGPLTLGVVLIVLLGGAMWWDGRRRSRLRVPSPEEQPKRADRREHIEEVREADDDAFPDDGSRLLPYNLKTHTSHTTGKGPEARPKHGSRSGGAFGSGSLGG
ncbi:DUF6479 family protein [Streptomyces pacificus]|uniref:Secreted protein n=1 Tax=Streptomyces pacificus TaxID=2705029 RepID=A0A6A0AV27_9ACTN|nr:DUF6479 family protein [Streptomyces pacificus]GFH36799.1 hypothetical protein SCWH03_30320 [Streptomyces pacificus]